jgi:replicative DNA helicase
MSEKIIDTLKKFGATFQCKCIAGLLSDKTFIERLCDIVDPTSFESDAHQWIVKEIVQYFLEYKTLPTLDCFKVKIEQIDNQIFKQTITDQVREIWLKTEDTDLTFIKEQFLDFCKNQKIKSALIESVEFMKVGEYEKIKHSFDQALKAGMERNIGHEYLVEVDKRMNVMAREYINTNWVEIDTVLDGGLAKGELGIIISAAGGGKSWTLAKLGAEAMKQGKNVLHVTLELNENYVGLRYDACFTGINFQDIRKHIDVIKQKIATIPGKLFIKYYPIKTVSANSLKIHVERIQMLGNKIDMMIVDYADILKSCNSDKNNNSYTEAGNIYEELRGVAGELQIPIWSASQSSRAGAEEDIITAGLVADSYRKIMTCDFVMSLSRKTADKIANTARVHVIKNRFGPDGMTFPCRMNAGNGDIQVYGENTKEGLSILNEMSQEENIVKKLMLSKYKTLMEPDEIITSE